MRILYLQMCISVWLFSSCGFDCRHYLENEIRPLTIKGVVREKQKNETGCFGVIRIEYSSKISALENICYCVIEQQGVWKYVEVGDSIYKAPKSLIIEVHRKNVVKYFDYPCCSR